VTAIVPAVGSALAIAYDVGYFWALDIKMFTMFSLTEHLVFALAALPFALIGAIYVLGQFASFKAGIKHGEEEFKQDLQAGSPEEVQERLASRKKEYRTKLLGAGFVGMVMAAMLFLAGLNTFAVLTLGFALYHLATQVSPVFDEPAFTQAWVATVVLTAAFAVGVDLQQWQLRYSDPTHIVNVDNNEVRGRLIRSGDRGILFQRSDPKEIIFMRWDNVANVTAITPPPKPPSTPAAPAAKMG
jgi:hypothetical protein